MGQNVEACSVDEGIDGSNFDEMAAELAGDLYWVRFFARPCCPAPDMEGASAMLDRLVGEVDASADYSADQKERLKGIIEARRGWYATSGLCRTSRG